MAHREEALRRIAVGDIFHASALNGASFVCLTLQVTDNLIMARRVTTQSVHNFDRTTGVEGPEDKPLTIDSVAPLPIDIRDILLSLDRKTVRTNFGVRKIPPGRCRLRKWPSA